MKHGISLFKDRIRAAHPHFHQANHPHQIENHLDHLVVHHQEPLLEKLPQWQDLPEELALHHPSRMILMLL